MISTEVPVAFDILDESNWSFILSLVQVGAIFFIHFGTPCNTFSAARKDDDDGPPPLRDADHPHGFPHLTGDLWFQAQQGNMFAQRTAEAALAVAAMGGGFSIENPQYSFLWATSWMLNVVRLARALWVQFDQCAWGAPSLKPTLLLVSHSQFYKVHKSCPGNHRHIVLKGKVFSKLFNRVVFRTKLAQEYPVALCEAMAQAIVSIVKAPLQHFQPSFELLSAEKRKRPLGQAMKDPQHRQARSAALAVSAGYQLKRGALKPLLDVETHPGEAIHWALSIPHPFTAEDPLPRDVQNAFGQFTGPTSAILDRRARLLQWWGCQAQALLPKTDQVLRAISDPYLRFLLRGVPDHEPARLGVTCHV